MCHIIPGEIYFTYFSQYRELRKYGGTKIREALNFAFKGSISDKLATEFTWCGEKKLQSSVVLKWLHFYLVSTDKI